MKYLLEAIFQGSVIFIFTILIPGIYSSVEAICYLIFFYFIRMFSSKGSIRAFFKEYSRGLLLRMGVLLSVSIILSLISIINYHRIISNPAHISSIYVSKMDAIFADINNSGNGVYNIFRQMLIYGLPSTSVSAITLLLLDSINGGSKLKKRLFYISIALSGAFLSLATYNLYNAMMGI